MYIDVILRRTQFTEEDKEHLCNWIAAKISYKEMGGRTGNRLYQQLCNMVRHLFFLSSHVLQPTHHLQGTPLQPFCHFSDPSSALAPLRYLSTTPTLNTFVPQMQWSTSHLPLFVGKIHQVMSHLVHLAVDLAVLHIWPDSHIGPDQKCTDGWTE